MTTRNPCIALLIAAGLMAAGMVSALAEEAVPEEQSWSHEGPLGTFDRGDLQRGFQVYREVCSACHGLEYISFRNLEDLGYSKAEIASLAAEYDVTDGPNDEGDMFTRPGVPADRIPSPFANDNAARTANAGALPPDLSLITKAREGGEDYIYALLTGYRDAPDDFALGEGLNYNPYFTNSQIAMPQPLYEGSVEFADGTEASVEQMAHDVTTFLAWAAEPTLEARKKLGFKVMIYLLILVGLMYAVNRRVWKRLKQ